MKTLIALAALFCSINSFASNVNCSMVNKDGDTIKIKIDTVTTEGEMSKISKGVPSTLYFLKVYIENANTPGHYFYEGLARAPMTGGDPLFFRLRYSQDENITTMSISEVGASKKEITRFSECTFR